LRRESAWFGRDYGQSLVDVNIPVVSHEVGQWVAYPDYDVINKFKGYMRPGNYEIFRDSLKAHGLLDKNKSFARASGRFQLACYKEEIEANLRTPGLGGFQLLDLHDYLGQGTALVGLLDAFWDPKSYVSAEEFKEFCNTTVPLARLQQRVFSNADSFNVDLELAHDGAEPIENGMAVWKIVGPTVMQGEWQPRPIPIGKNFPLGKISVDLSKLIAPAEYRLIVTVAPASFFSPVDRKIVPGPGVVRGVTYFENDWNFWVYPVNPDAQAASPPERPELCPPARDTDVLITSSWGEAEKKLALNGRVLFVPRNSDLDWTSPPLDSVPVFWNRLMGPAWGRMLGLWIDLKDGESKSYALSGFPTSSHFDWQWAQIIANVRAVNLERLPAELEPVVWVIDDWNRNYKLGAIFEVAVGDGRLLVSAFDVTNPASSNPVARQLRYALLKYARSDCFQPQISVTREQMRSLLFDTQIMKKLGAVAQAGGEDAHSVIDGDPNTFVRVGDPRGLMREKAHITITFPAPIEMSGLVLMPRQNHREHEGDIRAYVIQASDDRSEWRDVVRGELLSTFAPQEIEFPRTIKARYLRLISLSGFGPDKTTALAELAVIYAGPKLGGSNRAIEYQRNRSATPDIDEG
ncbi:MAG TPA: discoidin domain-containing protein, partial [Pyrinomonadaceae bacterium]|nr:discoidin domain-containing protein [Pyrinomonadaceae bacterium]